MSEPTVVCPNCRTEIRLTESLAAPLLEASRADFKKQLLAERSRIAVEESERAKLAVASSLEEMSREASDLRGVLRDREAKLGEAQKAQADLLRKQREFEDAKRELDLTVEKRVRDGLEATRSQARREAEDGLRLKVTEKEETIAAMTRQIEDLRRKAEQGSQQLQGEAQEIELENTLRIKFPLDRIEPVAKGEHGGDIVQHVTSPNVGGNVGIAAGIMLWESKRTKSWSDGWLPKLREDQRAAKADLAIIISQVLPKGVDTFDCIDGVWVAHPRVAVPVAISLRQALISTAMARTAGEGQQSKMALVYEYLTGPQFRRRVEAIIEAFSSMREDLDRERKAIIKQWAKRDEQIDRVMGATVGMYGDLQGVAGKSFAEIQGVGFLALESSVVGDE